MQYQQPYSSLANWIKNHGITNYTIKVPITTSDGTLSYELIEKSFNINKEGDNIVVLLSQLGWTKKTLTSGDTPNKTIEMEKVFFVFDTNGGNGVNLPVAEMINHLHGKIPHREDAMQKAFEYLTE